MWSGVKCRNTFRTHSGESFGRRVVHQVSRFRHSSTGFSVMIVSIMESGAGSVDVSARPALPSTVRTSGKRIRMRSCSCIRRSASVTEMPGSVDGM